MFGAPGRALRAAGPVRAAAAATSPLARPAAPATPSACKSFRREGPDPRPALGLVMARSLPLRPQQQRAAVLFGSHHQLAGRQLLRHLLVRQALTGEPAAVGGLVEGE